MRQLDEAIELLTKLRIQVTKEKHLSKFIEDKLKNIVDGIKRLEETP